MRRYSLLNLFKQPEQANPIKSLAAGIEAGANRAATQQQQNQDIALQQQKLQQRQAEQSAGASAEREAIDVENVSNTGSN